MHFKDNFFHNARHYFIFIWLLTSEQPRECPLAFVNTYGINVYGLSIFISNFAGWKPITVIVVLSVLSICSVSLNIYSFTKTTDCPATSFRCPLVKSCKETSYCCPAFPPCKIKGIAEALTFTPIPNMGQCMKGNLIWLSLSSIICLLCHLSFILQGYDPFKMNRFAPSKPDPGVRRTYQNSYEHV